MKIDVRLCFVKLCGVTVFNDISHSSLFIPVSMALRHTGAYGVRPVELVNFLSGTYFI